MRTQHQLEPPVLRMKTGVIYNILTTIGQRNAESGGAFGGNDDDVITHFEFDRSSANSAVTYSPDYQALNRLFKEQWNPSNIRLKGFVHSHPGRMNRPSYGDQVYAERILQYIQDLDGLWLPIVLTIPDTKSFSITPWIACRSKKGVEVIPGQIEIIHTKHDTLPKGLGSLPLNQPVDAILISSESVTHKHKPNRPTGYSVRKTSNKESGRTTQAKGSTTQPTYQRHDVSHTFNRVQDAYDLSIMRNSRIIAVGAGGAASWLEELARAGIEQFVLIDPDTVSETNLATQQVYRRDIGRPKVDCIAERIRDINPNACVLAFQKTLDDIDDETFSIYAKRSIDGRYARQTIICGLTDNFFAQARVNRLALHFGLPSLNAQVYKEGRGAEITFTYPGVTPACHRCILSSRYKHYLEHGQDNPVTSHGTPIFSTTRLNAIKGFILLALLHHNSRHPRWGKVLERIGNRNLVQLRLDPDFSTTLKMQVFDKVLESADRNRLFFDEAVWLPQAHECPETGYEPCPDCGGTGNLNDRVGRFVDTRINEN